MRYKKHVENLIVFQNRFYDDKSGELLSPLLTQNYEIIQGADSYYLSGFEIGKHNQVCDFEITYVAQGKIKISTEVDSDLVEKGEGYISFLSEHHALSSNQSARFISYAFNVKKDSPVFQLFQKVKEKYSPISNRKIQASSFFSTLTDIIQEFYSLESTESVYAIDSLTTDLIVKLARYGKQNVQNDLMDTKELIARIVTFLDDNYLSITSLVDVANIFGYSYNYMYKLFAKYHNLTISEYINSKKMDFAKEYLLTHSVTQTSEKLGYTSLYNFSRAYKKYFGKSPKSK